MIHSPGGMSDAATIPRRGAFAGSGSGCAIGEPAWVVGCCRRNGFHMRAIVRARLTGGVFPGPQRGPRAVD